MRNSAAHKKFSQTYGAVLLLLLCAATILFHTFLASQKALNINDRHYSLQVVSTEAERAKGLGGRESMSADQGMLFVFDRPEAACFWMKDMRFSLDIMWLDAGKRVIHVARDVSPQTYPKSFCPPTPAKYVIELNAGEAAKSGITTGHTLKF
jgi:uncharacterized membrane protein (UPF0127 family)